jgi:hypothetical protein
MLPKLHVALFFALFLAVAKPATASDNDNEIDYMTMLPMESPSDNYSCKKQGTNRPPRRFKYARGERMIVSEDPEFRPANLIDDGITVPAIGWMLFVSGAIWSIRWWRSKRASNAQ